MKESIGTSMVNIKNFLFIPLLLCSLAGCRSLDSPSHPTLESYLLAFAEEHNLAYQPIEGSHYLMNSRLRITIEEGGRVLVNDTLQAQLPPLNIFAPPPQDLQEALGDALTAPPATPQNRQWKYIVIHHSATKKGEGRGFNTTHLNRKWNYGLGYHFIIGNGRGLGDGDIETSYRCQQQLHGAHAGVREYNQHGIGICLVGNFEETVPTPKQVLSLKKLLAELRQKHSIPPEKIVGHRDLKATACPGKNLRLPDIPSLSK